MLASKAMLIDEGLRTNQSVNEWTDHRTFLCQVLETNDPWADFHTITYRHTCKECMCVNRIFFKLYISFFCHLYSQVCWCWCRTFCLVFCLAPPQKGKKQKQNLNQQKNKTWISIRWCENFNSVFFFSLSFRFTCYLKCFYHFRDLIIQGKVRLFDFKEAGNTNLFFPRQICKKKKRKKKGFMYVSVEDFANWKCDVLTWGGQSVKMQRSRVGRVGRQLPGRSAMKFSPRTPSEAYFNSLHSMQASTPGLNMCLKFGPLQGTLTNMWLWANKSGASQGSDTTFKVTPPVDVFQWALGLVWTTAAVSELRTGIKTWC